MNNNKNFALKLSALAIALQFSSFSYAATISDPTKASNKDALDELQGMEEVVVKGEKIDRKLDETLSSVAVTTAKDIRTHADLTLTDIMSRTPGVYTQSRNDTWGIRGIPMSGFDDQGPQTLNNAISVFVDGALQSNRLLTMSPLPLWDVKQVEVFRGSQSTVQGRNSLAGAIVLQTADPEFRNTLATQANVGSYGQRGGSVMANAELVPGQVAGRLALDYQTEDGYIKNETLDKDADSRRSLNARGKILLLPNDNSDLLLTLAHTDYRMGDNAVAQSANRPLYYRLFANTDARDQIQQNETTLKYNYYINNNWTITSISSGTHSRYDSLLDFDQRPTVSQEVTRFHKTRLLNQEVRLGYLGSTIKAHMGAYYGSSQVDFNDDLGVLGIGNVLSVRGDTKIRTQALFGEVNWSFLPRWQLITGLRYDREKNDTEIAYPVDLLGFGPGAQVNQSKSFGALLPKLGLSYQFAPQQLVGFTVQRGYRSGGVNSRAPGLATAYEAEYTTNYELAYRGTWLDSKLRTFANLYYTDWKDQQVASLDPTGTFATVSNAAKSRLSGLEMSANYDVTSKVRLFAGGSYNDTEYLDYTDSAGNDLSGKSFFRAPKQKYNLGMTYRYSEALFFNVDTTYQDSSAAAYFPTRNNDSVTLVNANVGYRFDKGVSVNAFVRNLLDRDYVTNNQSGGRVLDVGAPRTIGLVVRLDI